MIAVFEDELWHNFAPIVQTRPLFELRCGAFTVRERVAAYVEHYTGRRPTLLGLGREHLARAYGPANGLRDFLQHSEPLTLVNGRALELHWLLDLLRAPINTVYQIGDMLLGAHLSPALASAVVYYLRNQRMDDALHELRRFGRVVDLDKDIPLCVAYPWDLITQTGEQLVRDSALLTPRMPNLVAPDASITVRGAKQVYVAPSARLDGPIVLDARDGPVFIDEQAHIEPFSFIQGPTYIGPNTLIASARIRGESSFGPTCRIGGEVEASTVQGFSNKHHDGFLGHSWLGEWVNIGAMTTNSDLKNNYGNVRLVLDGTGQIDTGVLKLGCFLADHVKLGIGLHLNGGTVIGTGSNIFGVHTAPKTIPPFVWGGEVFREYRIESMVAVARTVMQRRKREMSDAYEAMIRAVFAMTNSSRGDMVGVPVDLAPRQTRNNATLAQAEALAVHAFSAEPPNALEVSK